MTLAATKQETALRAAVLDPYTIPSRHVHSTQVRGQYARARPAVAFDVTDKTSSYIPRQLSKCQTDRDLERITTTIDGWNLDTDAFDPADKLMQPRPQSRAIQSIQSIKDQAVNMPLDVDCYAEALLNDNQLEGLSFMLSSMSTVKKRKGFVDADKLTKNWKIGKEAARRTLEVTTQRAVRDFTHTTGGVRLKPYTWMLRHPRLDTKVYTDTMFGKVKSLRGNKCAQVYCTSFQYIKVVPMAKKSEAHFSLDKFFSQVGVPMQMVPDNAPELVKGANCTRETSQIWGQCAL